MKGFHVDEPAFHLDIPSLNPFYNFATSAALEHANQGFFSAPFKQEELSFHEFQSKFQSPQSFPSSKTKFSSFAEEKSSRGVDSFGNSAEVTNWGMNCLGNMILPRAEKRKDIDEFVCRGMARMEGSHGQGHVGDLQASMEATKGNHMCGFKYYMGIDTDHESNAQASIASIRGGHSGRSKVSMGSDQGNFVDDLQASMLSLTCNSPPGDNSLWRFLPSNHEEHNTDYFSSDDFRMYEFKVRKCMRGRSHDWTECPFAHPGEKARRRDPRRFHYSGMACPDFRRGTCRRGDSCELSHGVFECWLHPARYRTQLCKDNKSCKRRVCFFAHSPSQLRYVSPDPVPNNGFALKSPLASPSDAMASFYDVPHKQQPVFPKHSSPVGQGSLDSYGGDVFFDDLSPVNIHGFLHDGIYDGICPFTVHSKRVPNVRNPESFNGLSIDDISNHLKLSHSYTPLSAGCLVDEFGDEGSHGHSLYPYTPENPPSDSSSFKTSQTHVNLRNQLALASLTSNIDQIMSPTSPLIGHVFSPPPLSPPLSPSESPPMSPGIALSSRSMARKISSFSGQPLSQGLADANSMTANGTPPSVTQFQASLLANLAHSNGTPLFANTRGPSPLSTNSLGDKKHEFDRLSSMPTSLNSKELIEDESLQTASMEAHPAHAMAHLISTLQQMESRRAMIDVKNTRRPYMSHSNPNTPKSRDSWDVNGVPSNQRVESGQELRAKIYGKLGKEAGFDIENPDLGWVNELVK